MEIYVKITVYDGFKTSTMWWNRDEDGCSEFLEKSNTLCYSNGFEDLYAGTACKSRREARNAAKSARWIANWDGYKVLKVSFWKFDKNDKFIECKF